MSNFIRDNVLEVLAAFIHHLWAAWMKYLFGKGTFNDDGTWTMPKWAVDRWVRQMNTPYAKLTRAEQGNDIVEADKILDLLRVFRED